MGCIKSAFPFDNMQTNKNDAAIGGDNKFVFDSVYKVPELTNKLLEDFIIEFHSRVYNKKFKKETTEDNNALFYTKDNSGNKYYWYNNMVYRAHRDTIDLEFEYIYGINKYYICTDTPPVAGVYMDDIYDQMVDKYGLDKNNEIFYTELKNIDPLECLMPHDNVNLLSKGKTHTVPIYKASLLYPFDIRIYYVSDSFKFICKKSDVPKGAYKQLEQLFKKNYEKLLN